MSRRAILLSAFLLIGVVASCASPRATTEQADTIATLDPMFGDGESLLQRVRGSPWEALQGDAVQRDAFFAAQKVVHDAEARKLVAELVDHELADAVLPFLASEAGRALAAAETVTLTCYAMFGDDFATQSTTAYADAEAVGPIARTRFAAVQRATQEGHGPSQSPPQLAMLIGAMTIQPEQAKSIATFYRSALGQRWLQVRRQAYRRSDERFHDVRSAARTAGFLHSKLDDLDLVLPRAVFDAPAPTTSGR